MQEADIDAIVAAATGGDDLAFARLAQRYRPELHVHCYRMLGSLEGAEDRVQETFLRAWRKRATFEGWEPLSLLERRLPPGFERVVITVEPGESRCYDNADWLDALVVLHAGDVVLEGSSGLRQRFRVGATLCLTGLSLRALHSVGREPAVLVAVSRTRSGSDPKKAGKDR